MLELKIEKESGEIIQLTNNPYYTVYDIQGLSLPQLDINTVQNATFDGTHITNTKAGDREIVISLKVESPAEENRLKLYRYFQVKKPVKILLQNDSRDICISGETKILDCDPFANPQIAQITLYCPYPYFKDKEHLVVDFRSMLDLFEFPFSIPQEGIPFSEIIINPEKNIINYGDVDSGMLIKLTATGVIENPKIYNLDTREYLALNISLSRGDEVQINTEAGNKNIMLIREGQKINILNKLVRGSTWLQLQINDNLYGYTADIKPENLYCTFVYTNKYGGI